MSIGRVSGGETFIRDVFLSLKRKDWKAEETCVADRVQSQPANTTMKAARAAGLLGSTDLT